MSSKFFLRPKKSLTQKNSLAPQTFFTYILEKRGQKMAKTYGPAIASHVHFSRTFWKSGAKLTNYFLGVKWCENFFSKKVR